MKRSLLLLTAIILFATSYGQPDSAENRFKTVLYFQAQPLDKVVLLKWAVEQTGEYKAFDIERSENGSDFIKVGSRLAITKDNNSDYDFVDATPRRNVGLRYRIKLIYLNGTESFSELKEARVAESPINVLMKQNPVRSSIDLAVKALNFDQAVITIVSQVGQSVATHTVRLTNGVNHFTFPASSLLQGLYQMIVEAGGERKIISFIKE